MSTPSSRSRNEALLEQPFVAHLMELRDRLLRAVAAIAVIFLALFYFANDIYLFVASPLMAHLPEGTSMIATEVASPFLTPFKLTLMVSIFVAMPFILYQVWAFVAPGLYKHEQRMIMPLVVSSTLLYYLGMAFAYFVVFPLVFSFLIGITPEGVTVATDIAKYLDFVLTLFFAFGIAFEVPIATILLVWMGVTTPQALREKRPYVVVGAFIVGMLLTPPDIISQTLLALPMWLLFEIGILLSRYFVRHPEGGESEDNDGPADPGFSPHPGSGGPQSDPPGLFTAQPTNEAIPQQVDTERYRPLTPEEMDAELDQIEAREAIQRSTPPAPKEDPVTSKLRRIQQLRNRQQEQQARVLLYEVLVEGDEEQRGVARNILQQLDE